MRLLLTLIALALAAPARGAPPRNRSPLKQQRVPEAPPRVAPTPAQGGDHWRVVTPAGPVHIWRPPGYRPKTAGIVVYLHGYNTNPDRAFEAFKLAEQFKASQQNALFFVPGGPSSNQERVKWQSLRALLATAARAARLRLPGGHIVVAAHSGGFRTVAAWLEHPGLTHVILLDALYTYVEQFEAWLTQDEHHALHRLTLVGWDTKRQSEALLKKLRFGVRVKRVPATAAELSRRERRARLLYFVSQYRHDDIARGGKVLPLVLQLTRLRRL